jgi:hypothetical protein
MDEKRSGSGVIRFGEVEASGKWKLGERQLTISFEIPAMTDENKGRLTQYCTSCDPLPVQLPGEPTPAPRTIMGFERNAYEATLYLAQKPKPR